MNQLETYNLLIRYADGETSVSESYEVETLLANDPYWKNEYELILQLNKSISNISHPFNIDANTNENWEALKYKIKVPATRQLWPLYAKYAAAAVIILAAGWFLFTPSQNEFNKFGAGESYKSGLHQTKVINLKDGSTITLNENSELTLDKNFNINNRLVELKGDAYFEVSKKVDKPFITKTKNTYTKVLGTSFEIESKSSNLVKVSLYEGNIQFVAGNEKADLKPGEILNYSITDKTISKESVDLLLRDDWSVGGLDFKDAKLIDIVNKLESKYSIHISIPSSKANEQYTVSFETLNLEASLRLLEELTDSKIIKKDSNYILKP